MTVTVVYKEETELNKTSELNRKEGPVPQPQGETKLSRRSELNNDAAGRQDRQARQITPRMSQEETVLNIRAKLI